MPGKLEWKRTDPNRKGRGAGWYWHRGKGVYSQYTGRVDSKVDSKRIKIKDPEKRQKMQLDYPHLGDYKPGNSKMRRTLKKKYKGHKLPKTPKGHY